MFSISLFFLVLTISVSLILCGFLTYSDNEEMNEYSELEDF